jgi:hypothetical protein
MCEFNEKEIDQEVDNNAEIESKTIEDMSKEELVDVVYQLMEMKDKEIEVNTENVQDLEIDEYEFKAGIDSVSYMCGQFNALVSSGIDKASAIDIIMNERNIDFNLEANRMNCASSEKQSNILKITQEQNQI